MLRETELKLRMGVVGAEASLIDRARSLGAVIGDVTRERDEYFDTRDLQLTSHDLVVRLRAMGLDTFLALKTPRVFGPDGVYSRIELELPVSEPDMVRAQLSARGLSPISVIEKDRRTMRLGGAVVTIDVLPYLGVFVEVEAGDEAGLHRIVDAFRLGGYERVTSNYGELYEATAGALGVLPRPDLRAVFNP